MRIRTAIAATALTAATVLGGTTSAFAADGPGSGATAEGFAVGSPGVLSGNVIQVPVHIPINLCGTSVNVIALLNPNSGGPCTNS